MHLALEEYAAFEILTQEKTAQTRGQVLHPAIDALQDCSEPNRFGLTCRRVGADVTEIPTQLVFRLARITHRRVSCVHRCTVTVGKD